MPQQESKENAEIEYMEEEKESDTDMIYINKEEKHLMSLIENFEVNLTVFD